MNIDNKLNIIKFNDGNYKCYKTINKHGYSIVKTDMDDERNREYIIYNKKKHMMTIDSYMTVYPNPNISHNHVDLFYRKDGSLEREYSYWYSSDDNDCECISCYTKLSYDNNDRIIRSYDSDINNNITMARRDKHGWEHILHFYYDENGVKHNIRSEHFKLYDQRIIKRYKNNKLDCIEKYQYRNDGKMIYRTEYYPSLDAYFKYDNKGRIVYSKNPDDGEEIYAYDYDENNIFTTYIVSGNVCKDVKMVTDRGRYKCTSYQYYIPSCISSQYTDNFDKYNIKNFLKSKDTWIEIKTYEIGDDTGAHVIKQILRMTSTGSSKVLYWEKHKYNNSGIKIHYENSKGLKW